MCKVPVPVFLNKTADAGHAVEWSRRAHSRVSASWGTHLVEIKSNITRGTTDYWLRNFSYLDKIQI